MRFWICELQGDLGSVTQALPFGCASPAAATLAVASAGFLTVSLDVTIVNVALPTPAQALGASLQELQWIVDGYALVFVPVQITGGALSDTLGTRLFSWRASLCSRSRRVHVDWPDPLRVDRRAVCPGTRRGAACPLLLGAAAPMRSTTS